MLLATFMLAGASCAPSAVQPDADFVTVGECSVYEKQGEKTNYIVELGVRSDSDGNAGAVLGIQGFHPNDTSPLRIVEVDLADIASVKPERLSNDCVCGVAFAHSDEMCAYLSTYTAPLETSWLEEARDTGIALQFRLENGFFSEGPTIPADEIRSVLKKL